MNQNHTATGGQATTEALKPFVPVILTGFLNRDGKARNVELCLDDFNPDAMPPEGVADWLAACDGGRLPTGYAIALFGGLKTAINVRQYLAAKVQAMRYRLAGQIANARRYEQLCDYIYQDLPESVRW